MGLLSLHLLLQCMLESLILHHFPLEVCRPQAEKRLIQLHFAGRCTKNPVSTKIVPSFCLVLISDLVTCV